MSNQTITWVLKSGQTIAVTPSELMPGTWLDVTIDGREQEDGRLVAATDRAATNVADALTKAGLTHAIVCGKAAIGVTPEVAAQIRAAQSAAEDVPSPLQEQRETLLAAVAGLVEDLADAREAAFAGAAGRGWDPVRGVEAAIKLAQQALANFDAAHPEIAAAIEAEDRAATDRFLARD